MISPRGKYDGEDRPLHELRQVQGGTASLILVLSGIFFFVLSLVSQLLLTRGAISSHRSRKIQPRRKARGGNRSTGRKIISGKIR